MRSKHCPGFDKPFSRGEKQALGNCGPPWTCLERWGGIPMPLGLHLTGDGPSGGESECWPHTAGQWGTRCQRWSKSQCSRGSRSHLKWIWVFNHDNQLALLGDFTRQPCHGTVPRRRDLDRYLWETGSWLGLITFAFTCLIFLRMKWLTFKTRSRSPGRADLQLCIIIIQSWFWPLRHHFTNNPKSSQSLLNVRGKFFHQDMEPQGKKLAGLVAELGHSWGFPESQTLTPGSSWERKRVGFPWDVHSLL